MALTNQNRGESGVGTWTIIVKDTNVNDFTGSFTDWHLKLWGESRDASKAKVLPMPTEEDDNDHANLATTTVGAVTTTIAPPVGTGNPDGNPSVQPTEVPSRPIKPPQPSESTGTDSQEAEPENTQASNWLPSFLPSFGMSKATQVWIYGSLVLIVLFCSGLGIYFYLARRKRLRNNPRNEYEFELLDEEEAEGLAGNNSEKGVAAAGSGGRKGRTRGGELYDAFAGGSDDEDEFGGGAGGDERGVGYRDQPSSGGSSSGQRSSRSESGERFDEKGGMRRHSGEEEEEDEQHVIGSEESGSDGEESEEVRPLRR